MEKDFALIIGINDYTPQKLSGLKTLTGAINDANNFEKWALDAAGGNVPEENCYKITSLTNPLRPIQDEIDEAITAKMIPRIKELGGGARRLYFYFAGHGLGSVTNTADTALCLANWSELNRNKALSSEAYKDIMLQLGLFDEMFFIADCCRNPKINVQPMHPSFGVSTPAQTAGRTKVFMAYATQYQDQSFEIESDNSEMRGVFTKVLLDGLQGAAANSTGVINADSLRDYLYLHTPEEAKKKGYKQLPDISHSFASAVPLITLAHLQNATVSCRIIFSGSRNSSIELLDNSGVINSFDASSSKNIQINLAKGIYMLKDTVTEETKAIQATIINQEINVEF